MHIHAEIRSLPPGIAVAAQRKPRDGHDTIIVLLADELVGLPVEKRQGALDLFCQAVNALWNAPEGRGPVTLPLAS